MKERPILFSAPMVRAILAGQKTQTRRVMKNPPYTLRVEGLGVSTKAGGFVGIDSEHCFAQCPYGIVGDRLWVRETFHLPESCDPLMPGEAARDARVWYAADGGLIFFHPDAPSAKTIGKGRPSIHMPRWASRITLGITDVRVQRLQDISEDDARAEGAETWRFGPEQCLTSGERGAESPYRGGFACLWDEINAERATWFRNPWVWALTFTRVEAKLEVR